MHAIYVFASKAEIHKKLKKKCARKERSVSFSFLDKIYSTLNACPIGWTVRRDSARITIRENLKNPGDQNGARAASISNYFPHPRFFRELVDAEESFTFALATLFLSPRQECASSVDQHARHPRVLRDPLHLLPSPSA